MSILRVPEWEGFDWLEHGFGTRESETWTHRPERTWAKQIHSATVLDVSAPGLAGEADGLLTSGTRVLLEIRTADCIPVLLVDPKTRLVGAVHAGWRGVVSEIVPAAVSLLREKGSHPNTLQAAIGPGIGECCFEVGPEVSAEFGLSGRIRIDLKRLIQKQLLRQGLASDKIYQLQYCTKCDPASRFHSFRRDRESAGRMASAIMLRP